MDIRQKYINSQNNLKLSLIYGFGSFLYQGLKNCLHIIEEDDCKKLIYPIGYYIAIKHLGQKQIDFIPLKQAVKSLAVCQQSRKLVISGKNKPNEKSLLSIYNLSISVLKTQIFLEENQIKYQGEQPFISMSFSIDGNFLACLSGGENIQKIFYFKLELSTKIGQQIFEEALDVKNKHFKKDSTLICITGCDYFRISKVNEQLQFTCLDDGRKLKIKHMKENAFITDHVWFDENKIALSNNIGQVFIIQDQEIKQTISNAFDTLEIQIKIQSICSFQRGLIIGGETGLISIWIQNDEYVDFRNDKKDQECKLVHLSQWNEKNRGITNLQICENTLLLGFKNGYIGTLQLKYIIPDKIKQFLQKKEKSEQIQYINYLYKGFHEGPITQIEVCIQRPLIITCSRQDSSIIIWNYINFKCELSKKFESQDFPQAQNSNELLLSIAFHPFGYYLACGFVDKVRFYHILSNKLKQYRELEIKYSTLMRFSNGGQQIAIAFPFSKRLNQQNYLIIVYNSYTLENICQLKGHQNPINEILWSLNDNILFSGSSDGIVLCWNMISFEKTEIKSKIQFNTVNSIGFFENEFQLIVNDEQNLFSTQFKEDKFDEQKESFSLKNMFFSTFKTCKSSQNTQGIIAGSFQGEIKILNALMQQKQTFQVHDGAVYCIAKSFDGKYAFSAGQDGSLFIYAVSELNNQGNTLKKENFQIENNKSVIDEELADLVLIQKADIQLWETEIKKLKIKNQNIINQADIQQFELQKSIKNQINNLELKIKQQQKFYEQKIDEIRKNKTKNEIEGQKLIKNFEDSHLKAIQELENLYEIKLFSKLTKTYKMNKNQLKKG
ncbi:WD repeat protein [Ichthyophthirius multifiliis]|uniref:WD repeat protein n=1 Tax=Ichthyophthirius multifiliis TaxID=5932 RepID=G0QNJ8_ICHMU|nr:WD repeat protein [Ichthyophthirius multifiliis]EGR33214.1 WD repeat protein [Ichthyophthirius multifiliis]|eukprot:XP_004037200.1 WD repeat protein [Ichthyophthirius multifiliis]